MNLQTINYNLHTDGAYPKWAKMEDNSLLAKGREIVERHNMGKGGIVIAQVVYTDLMNYNFRRFLRPGIDKSAATLYAPTYTPFLVHHDYEGIIQEIPVGRNIYATYVKRSVDTERGTASGYIKAVTFVPEDSMVGNTSAISAIQSRLLLGISQSSSVPRDNMQCSICKESLFHEDCSHYPGQIYDGEICCIDTVSPFRFKEYSSVHTPAEVEAIIRRMEIMDNEGSKQDGSKIEYGGVPITMSCFEDIGKIYSFNSQDSSKEDGEKKDNDFNTRSEDMELKELKEAMDKLNGLIKDYEETSITQAGVIVTLSDALKDKIKTIDELNAKIDELTKKEQPAGGDSEDKTGDSQDTEDKDKGTEADKTTSEGSDNKDQEGDKGNGEDKTNTPPEDNKDSDEPTSTEGDSTDNKDGEGDNSGNPEKKNYAEIFKRNLQKRRDADHILASFK